VSGFARIACHLKLQRSIKAFKLFQSTKADTCRLNLKPSYEIKKKKITDMDTLTATDRMKDFSPETGNLCGRKVNHFW